MLNGADPRPADTEAIAIVGMGCRFPGGVDSPESFWKFLVEGRDAIGEVPPGRWAPYTVAGPEHAAAVRDTNRFGGFLADIDGFDAGFFRISPREAALMDPQQRLVLEVSWETLEHAGIVPARLTGDDVGVFVGVNTDDYGRRLLEDLPRIEAWTGIGASICAVANRVSYALDLRGPSLVVDTACSSSLVAIHLARQSLLLGESSLVLAGGVMLMAAPGLTKVMDAAGALAPDGRSKSFDASADGYGRGEGCGMLLLKRLSDARRDGDRILAVICGSSVNQDGKTNGIMAPNREAQEHLLRMAWRQAGRPPASVDYVEAHGTGTPTGDPIEAGALATVFGAGRPVDRPCLIGSVKTNLGHLEAASGVAGVIKTVLALNHGEIPPSLNFTEPSPKIAWETSGLRVATELTEWPHRDHPRRAGVSGYGYGGTVAHIALEKFPQEAVSFSPPSVQAGSRGGGETARVRRYPLRVYPLSGSSAAAVRDNARRLADWMSGDGRDTPLADIGHSLAHRRSHLGWRTAVVAGGREQLIARLREAAADEPAGGVTSAAPPRDAMSADPVWVFSGQGSQWAGMGRQMLDAEPAFRDALDELEPIFVSEMGFSPQRALLHGDLGGIDRTQSMIFAMQVALAAVWRSHGIRPGAIIGHSVGEIAAAVTAGVLDVWDGARLSCRRSLLLRRVAGQGAMAVVPLSFREVADRLAGRRDIVPAIAASPTSTVVSGDAAALDALVERWRSDDGLFVQKVDSDVAFHSHHVEPLVPDLVEALGDITPCAPRLPLYTTALTDPRSSRPRDAVYWAANLRDPVWFDRAINAALEDGHRLFLEVSPHPVVTHSITEAISAAGAEDAFVAHTLRRNRPEPETMLANLASLYCHHADIDWSVAQPDGGLADLPATAWQHREYRVDPVPTRPGGARQHDTGRHTLLGSPFTVNSPSPVRCWETCLTESSRPYPGDHPVLGTEIVPAAVLLNSFLAAADDDVERPALTDVSLRVPVAVTAARQVQIARMDTTLRLSSRLLTDSDGDGWLTHTTAVISPSGEDTAKPAPSILDPHRRRAEHPPLGFEELDVGFVVDRLASVGVAAMGFRWRIRELYRRDGELFASVNTVTGDETVPASWAPVFDAALSIASVAFSGPAVLRMPAHIRRFTVSGAPPAEALISIRVTGEGGAGGTVDVDIAGHEPTVAARFRGLRYGVFDGGLDVPSGPGRLVHTMTWRPLDLPARAATSVPGPTLRRLVLIGGDDELARALGGPLTRAGVTMLPIHEPAELDELTGRIDSSTVIAVAPPAIGGKRVGVASYDAAWLLIRTAQRLSARPGADIPRLWCLTRGVREAAQDSALSQSSLWGVGRVLASEHPEFWGGIVDLDTADPAASVRPLLRILHGRADGDVIALRRDTASVARLGPVDAAPRRRPARCRPDGTYLITGGLGVLGREVAHWLAGRGAQRLVLVGRRPMPPRELWHEDADPMAIEQIESVRSLEAAGITVRTLALDITDRRQAAKLLSPGELGLPPIRGVVHTAGVLDSRMVRDVDEPSLRRVMRPKVAGALVLHEMFPPGSLDFLVLFSSAGPLLGLPGQAAYAAANAFLDALAIHRRATGHDDTVSFSWTSWRGLGMSTSSEVIDAELAARGTADITASEAFRSWEYATQHDAAHVTVLRTIGVPAGSRLPPLLTELAAGDSPGRNGSDTAAADLPWAGLEAEELREYVVGEVRGRVAAEMQLTPDDLEIHHPLAEIGLDSVMALIVRRRLETHFRLSLPTTLLWSRPTVQAISDLLVELLSGSEDGPAADAAQAE